MDLVVKAFTTRNQKILEQLQTNNGIPKAIDKIIHDELLRLHEAVKDIGIHPVKAYDVSQASPHNLFDKAYENIVRENDTIIKNL